MMAQTYVLPHIYMLSNFKNENIIYLKDLVFGKCQKNGWFIYVFDKKTCKDALWDLNGT